MADQQTNEEFFACHAETIKAKEAEFGEVQAYRCPKPFRDELLIVAAPQNPKLFHALVNALQNEKLDRAVELERFALNCVVVPEMPRTKEIFKKQPAFALAVAGKAQDLAGAGFDELGKG